MFLKDTADTTVRVGIAAGDWRTIASGKHHGVYQHNGNIVIVGAPTAQGGPLGIFSMGTGIYIGLNYYVGEKEFRAIAVDKNNKMHLSQQSGGRAKTMKLWYTNAVFPGLSYEDLKEFQFQVRPYEWAEFRNVSLRPDVRSSTGILPVSPRGVSPVEDDRLQGQACPRRKASPRESRVEGMAPFGFAQGRLCDSWARCPCYDKTTSHTRSKAERRQ